jgi:prepilin-type N-terminal cleavage/methylation domain-containing protein
MNDNYKQFKKSDKVMQQGIIKSLRKSLVPMNPRILEPLSKGFTLIEIIIVIVILSIVSGITIKFLIDSLKIYTMTVNQKTLFDEGKLALERMCRDIRDARTITTPASGVSGNTIFFQRTNAAAQDGANESITFQRNIGNSTLEKVKTSPAATSRMADNVSSFTVTRGAAGNDEITLVLTLTLGTGENVTLQTRVYPKNLLEDTVPGPTPTYKNFFYCWEELRS